jgi:hypothetical protein
MGQKITLQNTGTNIGSVSYQNLSDLSFVRSMIISPKQTITIWCVTNSLNITRITNSNVIIVSSEEFPPVPSTPPTIPQRKTEIVIGTIDSSPNWQSYVFNYDTGSFSSPVNTGVNYTTCDIYNVYSLTKSGYMVTFYGSNEVYNNFYDYLGNVINSYSAESSEKFDYYVTDGFLIFIDYDNGVLLYSDGVTVKTIEWNTDNTFEVDGNPGSLMSSQYANSNKFVVYSGNGSYSTYQLIDMNGVTPLINYDNRIIEVYTPKNEGTNFISSFFYNKNSDVYSFFNIYDSNGKILKEIDLTNIEINGYDNFDVYYFGKNKMNVIFYSSDNKTPYQIYVYDGDTNTLTTTSHERGDNYGRRKPIYDYNILGINADFSQDIHIIFYDNNYSTDGDFTVITYCDILSYFDSEVEFSSYVFTSGNTSSITIDEYSINKSFQTLVDNGNDTLSLLTITSGGTSINTICNLNTLKEPAFNSLTSYSDTFIFRVNTNGGYVAYAYDAEGNQLDSRTFVGEPNSNNIANTFYIQDDINGWYFNNVTNSFVSVGKYNTYDQLPSSETDFTNKNNQPLLLQNGLSVRILYNDRIGPIFTVPESFPGGDVALFKEDPFGWVTMTFNSFMYIYRNLSGNMVCEVYDLSFNIIASQTTSESDWEDYQLYGDRALFITIISEGYNVYGISRNGNKSISILGNGYNFAPNDILWWFLSRDK